MIEIIGMMVMVEAIIIDGGEGQTNGMQMDGEVKIDGMQIDGMKIDGMQIEEMQIDGEKRIDGALLEET